LFSESDVALTIKYNFHDEMASFNSTTGKKRKITTADLKRNNVLEYSVLKLPALMFGQYLDQDCQTFIDDCIR
jgi:hypothetical protein